jgi:hypothetical protein
MSCGPSKVMKIVDNLRLFDPAVIVAKVSAALPFVIPSVPGFPATRHWTRQRVRLSVKKGA